MSNFICININLIATHNDPSPPEPNFDSLSYKPFSVDGNLTFNAELDPDVNFFQCISSLDKKYISIDHT